MKIGSEIGPVQNVCIKDAGFKVGNYFTLEFAGKEKSIFSELEPEELNLLTAECIRAAVNAGTLGDVLPTHPDEVVDMLNAITKAYAEKKYYFLDDADPEYRITSFNYKFLKDSFYCTFQEAK